MIPITVRSPHPSVRVFNSNFFDEYHQAFKNKWIFCTVVDKNDISSAACPAQNKFKSLWCVAITFIVELLIGSDPTAVKLILVLER